MHSLKLPTTSSKLYLRLFMDLLCMSRVCNATKLVHGIRWVVPDGVCLKFLGDGDLVQASPILQGRQSGLYARKR